MAAILIIDDDTTFCEVVANALKRRRFECALAHSAAAARTAIGKAVFDYVLLDLRLAADNGLELIPALRANSPSIRIVVLTGYASIATAVEAIKLGAQQYLVKPAGIDEILVAFEISPSTTSLDIAEQPTSLERREWEHIQKMLVECDGNISIAAERLGLHRRTLQRKLKKRPAGMQ